jgi:dTDP-4-dehydrorhamnose 3,5-epimerase
MIFTEIELKGAYIIDLEKMEDDRGFFARSWCKREFEAHGLNTSISQCNISYSPNAGTLRGMHYQEPKWEIKLVSIIKGAIFDVIIDLRPESPTYTKYYALILNEKNRKMLYIPEGFAHGFQTLQNNTEVYYQMSEFYIPENSKGVRYNDPIFGIRWPKDVNAISKRDLCFPDFKP